MPKGFVLTNWESGRRAVFTADENAPGGRPFLDTIEIQMARSLRDQSVDLELGKTDIVELGPNELRRQVAGRKVWPSSPVRLMALVFGPRITDVRVREALALAVDRTAIQSVLLQRQGEISGALLPQWLTGYAFLFDAAADMPKAQSLLAGVPPGRTELLAGGGRSGQSRHRRSHPAECPRRRPDGLGGGPGDTIADVRLVETRIAFADAPHALASVAAAFGLSDPPPARNPEESVCRRARAAGRLSRDSAVPSARRLWRRSAGTRRRR